MIRHVLILMMATWVVGLGSYAVAGLRDIHPRPQQMGMVSSQPLTIPGTFYLVVPDNLTPDELAIKDEAMARIQARVFRVPIVRNWSQYGGETPAMWLGTDERMPALDSELSATEIPGLGNFTHGEEYQIYVGPNRILVGGNDLLGLRWGIMSAIDLMAETNGAMYVDRAYVRDWPELPQRVVTINSPIRNQEQAAVVNQLSDAGYEAKMNEVEWNDQDAGQIRSPFAQTNSLAVREKLRLRGVSLRMSVDRSAHDVAENNWQEGIPTVGTKLRVMSDETLSLIPNGFNLSVYNGGFESWTDGLPTGWITYYPEYVAWVARDQVTRHSGTSSVKFYNLNTAPPDLDVRRYDMVVGDHRYLKIRFWYKLLGFKGSVRAMIHGPAPVEGMMDRRILNFTTPTTQDWTQGEFNFHTGYTDSITIYVGVINATQGTAWFDDISLEAGTIEHIVRRPDTPFDMYKLPSNLLLVQGLDYQIEDTSGENYNDYHEYPRISRVSGGRLGVNDSVSVNWACAVQYEGGRQTECFSLMEPLLAYQERIRKLDSLMHPDAFKIHINEVSYANYDLTCTQRNMSPGELVGRYCDQMYDAIQSIRPGAPVRIYGDAFDIWVDDPRLHPITSGRWTTGSLQELNPAVQAMAMPMYSDNIDSSLAYFQANNHTSILSAGVESTTAYVQGALAARRWPGTCQGMQIFGWDYPGMHELIPTVSDLGWNMGPYIVHTPVAFISQPPNVTIRAEMWTDEFQTGDIPILTTKQLRYRLLPSGSWTTVNLSTDGTDSYLTTVNLNGQGVTGIEYYLTTTDYRGQTRKAPYNAPVESFVATFPGQFGGPSGRSRPVYDELKFSITDVSGSQVIEWQAVEGVSWYELHSGETPNLEWNSTTLLSRQQPCCPRYLIAEDNIPPIDIEHLHVFAARETSAKPVNSRARR